MKLFNFFKKKDEIEIEIRKQPRKNRKRLRELYIMYQKGLILQVDNKTDNKEYLEKRQ